VLIIAGEAEGTTIIAEGAGWNGGEACRIGSAARLVVSSDDRRLPVFAPASQAPAAHPTLEDVAHEH
jgi:hypothetical protein